MSIEENSMCTEAEAVQRVLVLARELAIAARPLAGWGDGNCGYIVDKVLCALEAEGLYTANLRRIARGKK